MKYDIDLMWGVFILKKGTYIEVILKEFKVAAAIAEYPHIQLYGELETKITNKIHRMGKSRQMIWFSIRTSKMELFVQIGLQYFTTNTIGNFKRYINRNV